MKKLREMTADERTGPLQDTENFVDGSLPMISNLEEVEDNDEPLIVIAGSKKGAIVQVFFSDWTMYGLEVAGKELAVVIGTFALNMNNLSGENLEALGFKESEYN